MKAFMTLDYELFFGAATGTPERCLFEPTEALLKVLDLYGIKAVFFVDIAYIDRALKFPECRKDVDAVRRHLEYLQRLGHELQLHIHPHWYLSRYETGRWEIDVSRYKLSDLAPEEARSVIQSCARVFSDITGRQPLAFRAGGWCIDGFEHFSQPLYDCGVRIDSTVYPNGWNISETQGYDFRQAPNLPMWRFSDNPLEPVSGGAFFEMPISSLRLDQMFYWQQLFKRFSGDSNHQSYGDGRPTLMSVWQLMKYLAFGSTAVASIDGQKAGHLDRAMNQQLLSFGHDGCFVVLGHPKALSPSSLKMTADFLYKRSAELDFETYTGWYDSIVNQASSSSDIHAVSLHDANTGSNEEF